jgi:ABC-type antimicrobial peptide transport system permease subunit
MALGAWRSQVLTVVLHQSLALITCGLVLGVGGAAAAARYLTGLLFGLTPLEPATFVGVVLMFFMVATLGSYVPARRATQVDPMVALRCE